MELNLTRTNEELVELFKNLKSKADVANLLEINTKVLNYYLYASNNYKMFTIPKKDGSKRIINSPNSNIKIIQQKLLHIFYLVYRPHENAYGFIKGKNILDNALNHSNKKYVLNIDLENFFHSIHFGRICGLFKNRFNFNNEVLKILTNLVCIKDYSNSYLPQGAPTSPILSNIIANKLDTEMTKYAKKYNSKYTRYADDITISFDSTNFPKQIAYKDYFGDIWLHTKIVKIIENNGFLVNFKKIRLRNHMQRQEVTGLIVNSKKPNVKREYIKNIRAVLYKWEKHGYAFIQEEFKSKYKKNKDSSYKSAPKIENYIDGKLNYLSMIRGTDDFIYLKFKEKFEKLKETIPKKNNDT